MNAISPPTILIVEDNPALRETLAELLHTEGYLSASAADGQDALAYLHRSSLPSLILLDLMMPRMDGVEFGRQLKQSRELARVPVIVISAIADQADAVSVIKPAACFTKPPPLDELLDEIARHCPRV